MLEFCPGAALPDPASPPAQRSRGPRHFQIHGQIHGACNPFRMRTCKLLDLKSFRMRTCKSLDLKSFRMRTYKSLDLKSFRMRTCTKRGGGVPPHRSVPG